MLNSNEYQFMTVQKYKISKVKEFEVSDLT